MAWSVNGAVEAEMKKHEGKCYECDAVLWKEDEDYWIETRDKLHGPCWCYAHGIAFCKRHRKEHNAKN